MDKNNSKNKDMEMGKNNITLGNTGAAAGKGRKGCRWSQLVAGLLLWGFSVMALALATPTGVQISGRSDTTDTSYTLSWNAVTGATSYIIAGLVNGSCVTLYCVLQSNQANDRTVSSSELPSQFRVPGSIELRVLACNTSECSTHASVNLEIVANTAPSVTLTSPADDAEYRTGDTVTLSGTATDSQDNISSVKFYVGGSLVNTDTSSPYSYDWTATLGSHSVYARVTDSGGLSANSSTHDITVSAPLAAPTGVRITGKSNSFDTSYELRWNAVTGAGTYLITGNINGACVTLYCILQVNTANDRIVASSELPVQFRSEGTIVLQVRACDSASRNCSSLTPVTVQIDANTAPSVTLTSPADDAEYRTGDTVTLSGTATDSQDNISSVKFYVDGSLVNTDTSSPYSYDWTATLGSHSVYARVTDSGGLSANSSTHDITVTAPLAAPTGVRIVGKSDDVDSSYELHWNAVSRAGAYWVVGSVNGACVTPYCLLVYTSASDRIVSSSELPSQFREPGMLQLQVTACNSDRSYCGPLTPVNLEIVANTAPTVTLTAPTVNSNLPVGTSVTLEATAADTDGSITKVEFFVDGDRVGTDTSSPYQYNWVSSTLAINSLTAKATDNAGGVTTSEAVSVRRTPVAPAPTISNTVNNYDGNYTLSWNHTTGAQGYWIAAIKDEAGYGGAYGLVTYVAAEAGTSSDITSAELMAAYPSLDYSIPGEYEFLVFACTSQTGICSDAGRADITVEELAAPANLSISNDTNNYDGDYTLSWNHSTGAHGYRISASRTANGVTDEFETYLEAVAGVSPAISSAELTAVYPDQDYTDPGAYEFSIVACTAQTDGVCSTAATAEIMVLEIAAPANLSISNTASNTDGVYTLSWDNVAGAQGYVIGALKNEAFHGGDYGYVTYVPRESGAQSNITSAELDTAQPSHSYTTEAKYEYLVVACTAQTDGVCSEASRASIRVYSEISNGFTADSAPLPTAVTNASAQESSDKVGASAGQFRVNESGAATYTMPLTLLAGTAGVEPPLRFNYNSQGGSGLMGRGWSIGGLSAIERCRQTLHQDRKAMPITWSDKDRFCLDGQRLVLDDPVNGTYGAVGTVYRTELDSFAKVTSVGGGPNPGNPDYFKVERKDGSVSYYGATPDTSDTDAKLLDSSTSTDPKTFRWALKKFRDNMDNPIWYIYANDDNGQRIDEVRYAYGANETTPDAGYKAVVKFEYASTARTDAAKAYIAGYGFVNDKLLTKVTVKSGLEMTATEIWHYKLSYQADNTVTEDKVTRLEKIEECEDTTCYLDTEFTWPDPVSPFPTGTPAATASLTLLDRNYPSVLDYEFADINGDGATDIVWQALDIDESDTDHELWYALSSADGMMVAGTFSDGTDRIYLHENYAEDSLGTIRMEVLDYNADGRQDVALFHHGDSKWKVFLSTYTTVGTSGEWRLGFSPVDTRVVNEHVTFADIDSDGLVDAVRATAPVAATEATETTAATPAKPAGLAVRYLRLRDPATLPATERAQAYEFDADEVAPAYQASTNETLVIPAGDDLSDLFFAGRSLVTPNALTVLQPAGDFNGDGKSEIYVRYKTVETAGVLGGSTSRPFYNHRLVTQKSDGGARTLLSRYSNPGSVSSEDALVFGDINGDGLTDIVYAPPLTSGQSLTALRTVKYWLNTGAASTTDQLLDTLLANAPTISLRWNRAATTGYQAPPPRLVDMNHDGFLDLTWYDAHENKFRVAYWDGPMASFGAAQELFTTLTVDDEELNAHLLLDMDGDGWMDRIHMAGETLKVYASANKGADRSVITGITNGLDAVTTIDYATLSDADVYERLGISLSTQTMHFCLSPDLGGACSDFPYSAPNLAKFYTMLNGAWTGEDILGNNAAGTARQSPVLELIGPMPVVKKVTGSAPGWKLASTGTSGNSNDASATSSISYQYGQAKIQASGRGFLGFERLKTIDEQTNVTTTTQYRQDFPYIGRPLSTEVRTAGGKLLRKSTSTWKLQRPASPTVASMATTARDDGTAKLGALRPVLSKTDESRYALDTTSTPATQTALSKVVTTNTHDAFGNLNKIVTETRNAADAVVASQTTTNEYHDTGFGTEDENRQAGRLTKSTVVTDRPGIGANTRIATFDYYDELTDFPGLLQTETVQPGTHEQLVTTHTYDSRGNTEKVASVGKVGKAGTTATQQRYTEFEYDSDMRYLEYTKESFGGVSYQLNKVLKKDRDAAGRVLRSQSVAPDGAGTAASQETGMAYGALGRPFLEYNTSTGARSTTYYSATVTGVCPATAQYRTETRSAGGGISQVCYDRLAREVRRRSQGFAGTGYYQVDTQYDILGRVKRVSEPHLSGAMTIYWTENQYDILGRLTRIDHPHTTTDTTIVYSADSSVTGAVEKVVTTNAKSQESTEYRNALGEVVKVENPLTASVTYAYDAAGNLKQTVANGVTTTISYDVLGRKQSMTDPDKGQWSYQYNAFGELVEQTSANGVVSTLTHDAQGRRLSRTDARSATTLNATTWSYDTQTMADTVSAPGQLTRTVHTISSGEQVGSHSVALAYDTLGRLMGREVSIDGNAALTFEEQYTYDQYGRPFQKFDASDDFAGVRYHYNSAGYLAKVSESAKAVPANPGATTTAPVAYYTVTAMNARGQVTGATLGNGVVLDRTYQAASGYLNVMKATNGMSQELQKLTLTFDELGNLTQRRDQGRSKLTSLAKNVMEAFTYDNLNRLLTTRIAGEASANVDTTHDARGNIKTKSGVGAYVYGAASNRLVSVTPSGGTAMTYAYDSNGNLTSGDGRTLRYTSFDKPHTITKGTGQTVKFAYDGERARYKRSVTTGTGTNAVTTTTYYVGNVEIRNVTGGKQYTRYVEGHAIVKLTRNDTSRTAISTDYLITDHLGSIDAIANSSGALLYDLSFDAWGRRRAADSTYAIINTPATALTTLTPRGFTGHEMLDTVGLIHMNGRVYDPRLGRFTSADPIVQFPHYSQSFNHYSYVLNNPLSLTDPSGHFLPVIAGVIAVAQGLTAGYVALTVGIAAFAQALIEGASFGDALFSGISAAALTWAGGALYPGAGAGFGEYASYVATVGTIGGMSSSLQGGKFGHGFLSAGVGGVAGGTLGGAIGGKIGSQVAGRLIGSALVGGTISEVTGGKFANGAAYGAFATLVTLGVEAARKPTPQEVTYARLAKGVDDPSFQGADGYVKSSTTFFDENTGLQSALFVNEETGHSVLAFAPTNGAGDWPANSRQAFGFESAHYEQAITQAQIAFRNTDGNIHFVGTSLGGGLAMASAIMTRGSATVFNSAGVHPNTVRGQTPAPGSITHFRSSFDVLQVVNAITPARVYGEQVFLGQAGFHSMDGVCRVMGC